MGKLVYGVGIYEKGEYVCKISYAGKYQATKEYMLWRGMLRRCSDKHQQKHPTYIGCLVSDNFKSFQYFAEWCNNQIGFGLPKYQLDKDILVKGNKVYSEHTCAFVPDCLNMVLVKNDARRGQYPVGVYFNRPTQKFMAYLSVNSRHQNLGLFSTPEEAFLAYKEAKEQQIKLIAELYKDSIDPRVYQALLEYAVEMDD